MKIIECRQSEGSVIVKFSAEYHWGRPLGLFAPDKCLSKEQQIEVAEKVFRSVSEYLTESGLPKVGMAKLGTGLGFGNHSELVDPIYQNPLFVYYEFVCPAKNMIDYSLSCLEAKIISDWQNVSTALYYGYEIHQDFGEGLNGTYLFLEDMSSLKELLRSKLNEKFDEVDPSFDRELNGLHWWE